MESVELGRSYTRLTALRLAEKQDGHGPRYECVCACGEPRVVRGNHLTSGKAKSCGCIQRLPAKETQLQRFEALYRVEASGCWQWLGTLQRGYGRFKVIGKKRQSLAHRASYEMFVEPIPDNMHIDHLCTNRGCVNPKHLEAVTQHENNRRSREHRGPGIVKLRAELAATKAELQQLREAAEDARETLRQLGWKPVRLDAVLAKVKP